MMQDPAGEVVSVEVPKSAAEVAEEAAAAELMATTEVADDHGAAPETWLGLDSTGWAYVSISIFILLAIFVFKAPKLIAEGLDARIANVKRDLAEAKTIRDEAEALLAEAKAREAQGEKDAAAIVEHARAEADQLVADAKNAAENLVARRTEMAEAKISAAARSAEEELRARAANLAAATAAKIIADQTDDATRQRLTDEAIGELADRLNS